MDSLFFSHGRMGREEAKNLGFNGSSFPRLYLFKIRDTLVATHKTASADSFDAIGKRTKIAIKTKRPLVILFLRYCSLTTSIAATWD